LAETRTHRIEQRRADFVFAAFDQDLPADDDAGLIS
jgi:hypothetical protein